MPASNRPPLTLHVVTHTHWDREWYRTAEEFRLFLVDLVDEVLAGAAGAHFLLDGQTILLLDYLAVRPERRDALAAALRDGRLEAGPWFVLGDNLIPGGEALVRNLLAGRDVLSELGATAPAVLYCPDAFGHPAALPQLAAGFALPVAVVWRGYGGPPWPPGDTARWVANDASAVLLHHLAPDGYELGANLPVDVAAAVPRWERLRGVLAPRSTLGVALLPNGADHHAVQARRADAIVALTGAAAPTPVIDGGLGIFAAALIDRAAITALPVVRGELRRSPDYVWSLQGTFGSRAAQKRTNALAECLLVHHVEPLTALAWWRDGVSRRHEARALWRTLLSCHPHDTLCGCSSDAVADAMDQRLREVRAGGALAARRARLALLGHDPAHAREHLAAWRPVVALWNPLPRQRGGICELEIDEPIASIGVGPGSADIPVAPARPPARPLRLHDTTIITQDLSRAVIHVREESPRHYPRNTLVRRRRLLAWVDGVDAMAMRTLPLVPGRARVAASPPAVRGTTDQLDNARCRVTVDDRQRVSIESFDGARLHDVIGLEAVGDQGDLYTHSPIPGTAATGVITRHRLTRSGPLRAEMRLTLQIVVPARVVVDATGVAIRHRASRARVTVDLQLDAGAPTVALVVRGTHAARDCRLRLLLRTGIACTDARADAAFAEVSRAVIPRDDDSVTGAAHERESRTAPLHRYVSVYGPARGVTVFSDGLAEYEVTPDGTVAVTLVRSVGDLSRATLRERPGHAGWPVATPGAQSVGPFEARLAILLHGARSEATDRQVQQSVEDFLLPMVGETWASALVPPSVWRGARLTGEGLAYSSCKQSDDGASLVVRCVNRFDRTVVGSWELEGVRDAWLARLDETELGALAVCDGVVRFCAPPHATITILLRA